MAGTHDFFAEVSSCQRQWTGIKTVFRGCKKNPWWTQKAIKDALWQKRGFWNIAKCGHISYVLRTFIAGTNFHSKIRFLPLKWANRGVEWQKLLKVMEQLKKNCTLLQKCPYFK